jgi:hypothetical protein
MKKLKYIFILFLSLSCKSQNCETLNENFSSYEVALKSIKATNFNVSEKLNTSKSIWIKGAEYYSCDEKQGYLLILTAKKTYIHSNVPIETWYDFKKAESFGRFYNSRIKGRYQLIL